MALGAGIVAYLVAVTTEMSLVALLLAAYGAVVQLAPLTVAALFWRRATAAGALAGLAAGASVTLLLFLMPGLRPFGLHEGIVGLIVNVGFLVTVSLVTATPDPESVDLFMAISREQEAPRVTTRGADLRAIR